MKSTDRSFGLSLAAATVLAFCSLAGSYWWASQQLTRHFATRERSLRDSLWMNDESEIISLCESMTIGPASLVALTTGLVGFATTAIIGIRRRPWSTTALVLAPMAVWFWCGVLAFAGLSEQYFP